MGGIFMPDYEFVPEKDIETIRELLDEIGPQVHEIADHMLLYMWQVNESGMTDEERQRAADVLMNIFKYSVCLGLYPFLCMISRQVDTDTEGKSSISVMSIERLMSKIWEENEDENGK